MDLRGRPKITEVSHFRFEVDRSERKQAFPFFLFHEKWNAETENN
jgi:hypothetical protein